MKYILSSVFLTLFCGIALAINDWFIISYRQDGLPKVKAALVGDIDSVSYSYEGPDTLAAGEEFVNRLTLSLKDGEKLTMSADSVTDVELGNNIPTVFIDTDSLVDEIPDKVNYLSATFRYIPYDGLTDTLETTVNIRGRGNTSWEFPKKPYRLKFEKKQSVGGLKKAKSYVLISNYLDNTLMKNTVAFKIAELVGMDYYNHSVPVNLVLNGQTRGSYLLTEKVGINAGSIDIDEEKGVLWEIDSYFDEDYRFRSSRYNMPVMLKDPDFMEIAENDSVYAETLWNFWKADLDLALAKVYHGKWQEAFDARKMAKFILVNNLVGNYEIKHPKSTYLYKESVTDKYAFGPVWDFDWAMGFEPHYPVNMRLTIPDADAYEFFRKIFETEEFMQVFAEELDRFSAEGFEPLMSFIEDYAARIRTSALEDAEIWPAEHYYSWEGRERNTSRFDENVDIIREFLTARLAAIKADPRFLLY